jgi:hypothetical protein
MDLEKCSPMVDPAKAPGTNTLRAPQSVKTANKRLKMPAVLRIVDLNMVRLRLMDLRSITQAIRNDAKRWVHPGESTLSNQVVQQYLEGARPHHVGGLNDGRKAVS